MTKYIAHISENGEVQSVYDHLRGVADKMSEFASAFGAQEEAEQIGLSHDIGKYSDAFRKRILNNGPRVDHSTAGAVERWKREDLFGALCVAGHHGGLPDMGMSSNNSSMATLCGRIKRRQEGLLEDYSAYASEVQLAAAPNPSWAGKQLNAYFYVKMLFSCLVDADFLDTEEFMQKSGRKLCGTDSMTGLWEKLSAKIKAWENPSTELNRIRSRILRQCIEAGREPKGLYSLTVPTGGGKTVSSLAFALRQACEHGMERIIYVIPYTSIIDQTVATFEDILGENNVLAHYSEASYEDKDELSHAKRLAAENWKIPVVVTTSVQFFESVYSNKVSKNRKLHHIANSVLVFDEYQMLPVKHMKPCTEAIYQFVRHYGCTALICTATQPGTDRFFHEMKCREIVGDVGTLFQKLTRVRYCQAGKLDLNSLSNRLMKEDQVLCIVNTRKTAQEVYDSLKGEGRYHLSTWMLPKDRKKIIDEIRRRLAEGKRCRVVSTSLIEAGIDVDFPTVYREENGLDSLIQAAGRCNREGRRPQETSLVWIFSLDRPCPSMQRINRDSMVETLQLGYEIGSPESVKKYFQILFDAKGEDALDGEKIISLCERGGENGPLPFRTISERFRMIDEDTKTVYVLCDAKGMELCGRLADGERTRELFRKLGQYGLNLYPRYYARLRNRGALLEYDEDVVILTDLSLYSKDRGLQVPEDEGYTGVFI